MFRSPTTPSFSPSFDRYHLFPPLPLPADKSVPCARTARLGTASFRSFILATHHSPLATIPFRIRTSEKHVRKPSGMNTSKTQHLKPFRMNTYEKTGGAGLEILNGTANPGCPFAVCPNAGCRTRNTQRGFGPRLAAPRPEFTPLALRYCCTASSKVPESGLLPLRRSPGKHLRSGRCLSM